MDYLKLFENHSEYETFVSGGTMMKPNVSHCVSENDVHYNQKTWTDEYLTFVALEDGTFTFTPNNNNRISYSVDNGVTWTQGTSVTVSNGDKVQWKGTWKGTMTAPTSGSYAPDGIGKFGSTCNFDAKGNVMSLLFGDNFKGQIDLTGRGYAFSRLFYQNTYLVSAENLSLPATTLSDSSYAAMFYGCTSLTVAPELPATTLESSCYSEMFRDCTNITTAPELPATTLVNNCYRFMFTNCTNLAIAPELPATTLASNCYWGMFSYCTNLAVAPELSATTLAGYCYRKMFSNCTSLTQEAVVPSSVTPVASSYCYEMYCGCHIATHSGNYDSAAYDCYEPK